MELKSESGSLSGSRNGTADGMCTRSLGPLERRAMQSHLYMFEEFDVSESRFRTFSPSPRSH